MRNLRYAWPPVLWAALIFAASSIPGNRLPELGEWSVDKWIHAVIFGLLTFLVMRYFLHAAATNQRSLAWALAWGIAVSLLYAASDELHQLAVPNRSCELGDFIADAIGVGTIAVVTIVRQRAHALT